MLLLFDFTHMGDYTPALWLDVKAILIVAHVHDTVRIVVESLAYLLAALAEYWLAAYLDKGCSQAFVALLSSATALCDDLVENGVAWVADCMASGACVGEHPACNS